MQFISSFFLNNTKKPAQCVKRLGFKVLQLFPFKFLFDISHATIVLRS